MKLPAQKSHCMHTIAIISQNRSTLTVVQQIGVLGSVIIFQVLSLCYPLMWNTQLSNLMSWVRPDRENPSTHTQLYDAVMVVVSWKLSRNYDFAHASKLTRYGRRKRQLHLCPNVLHSVYSELFLRPTPWMEVFPHHFEKSVGDFATYLWRFLVWLSWIVQHYDQCV